METKMRTAADLVAWVARNADRENGTPEEQTLWFVSFMLAEEAMDDLTTEDLARMFRDGIQPATMDEVQEWLDRHHENEDGDPETDEDELVKGDKSALAEVEDFFGA